MKYYLLVDEIKEEHKPGIYGRRKPTHKEIIEIIDELGIKIDKRYDKYLKFIPYVGVFKNAYNLINIFKKQPIVYQSKLPDDSHKQLIIKYNLLNNNFNIDEDFNYGLTNNLSFKEKHNFFKTLMTSKGGSSLIIVERKDLPSNIKHYGGEEGTFYEGLYLPHPKDENLLIPLKNFNKLIQTLILEETVRVYEALGAKIIIIKDITVLESKAGGKKENVKLNTDASYSKQILRRKEFGEGTFDPERALKNKLFIHDMPAVMSTIEARIKGNQTLEEFKETIDLNIGMDINVLNLFESNGKIAYQREWYFKVEFYDKNKPPITL